MTGSDNNECWWRWKTFDKDFELLRAGAALDAIGLRVFASCPDGLLGTAYDLLF